MNSKKTNKTQSKETDYDSYETFSNWDAKDVITLIFKNEFTSKQQTKLNKGLWKKGQTTKNNWCLLDKENKPYLINKKVPFELYKKILEIIASEIKVSRKTNQRLLKLFDEQIPQLTILTIIRDKIRPYLKKQKKKFPQLKNIFISKGLSNIIEKKLGPKNRKLKSNLEPSSNTIQGRINIFHAEFRRITIWLYKNKEVKRTKELLEHQEIKELIKNSFEIESKESNKKDPHRIPRNRLGINQIKRWAGKARKDSKANKLSGPISRK